MQNLCAKTRAPGTWDARSRIFLFYLVLRLIFSRRTGKRKVLRVVSAAVEFFVCWLTCNFSELSHKLSTLTQTLPFTLFCTKRFCSGSTWPVSAAYFKDQNFGLSCSFSYSGSKHVKQMFASGAQKTEIWNTTFHFFTLHI